MARQVRSALLDGRDARTKNCKPRRAPYWWRIAKGAHIGYRRLSGGYGTWQARWRDPVTANRFFEALGNADDFLDADGVSVFDWEQAQARPRAFQVATGENSVGGRFTVNAALDDYFTDRERRGIKAKGVKSDRSYTNARVRPVLGDCCAS